MACRKVLFAFISQFTILVASFSTLSAVEITLWEHEKEADQKFLDSVIKDFQSKNSGIKVKRSHYDTEGLRTKFQTSSLAGSGGDLVLAPNDFAGPFVIMGAVAEVTPFLNSSRFYSSVVAAITDDSGKTWGLPVSNGNHLMLFVNKKLLAKAPTTIEELVTSAKKITDKEKKVYGLVYNLNEPFWFVSFLTAFSSPPLVGGKPQLDNPGTVQALELVRGFKYDDKIVPSDCDYACADSLFKKGQAAMVINGDWAARDYYNVHKENLIIAALPKSAKTGKPMAPMVSGKYLFFSSSLKGKKLDAAKKFAEFMVSPEIQKRMVSEVGKLPAIKAAAESKEVTSDRVAKESIAAMQNGIPMPMDFRLRAVWDAIRPELQRVMAGRKKSPEAAKKMQIAAQDRIKKSRR